MKPGRCLIRGPLGHQLPWVPWLTLIAEPHPHQSYLPCAREAQLSALRGHCLHPLFPFTGCKDAPSVPVLSPTLRGSLAILTSDCTPQLPNNRTALRQARCLKPPEG